MRLMAGVVLCAGLATAAQAQAQALPPSPGYDGGGRRDPFVSVIAPKPAAAAAAPAPAAPRPIPGLPGLAVKDARVTGIMRSGATAIAILQAPNGTTFLVHAQDRLRNGLVKEIDADSVMFVENITDDRGHVVPRDVRKPLRAVSGDIR